jgi:hypothetical protein
MEEYDEEMDESDGDLEADKAWLATFINDKLKKRIASVEFEVNNISSKKIRGANKKQKEMLKALNDKLKLMIATRVNIEELAMTMAFLEGGAIKMLKSLLKKYDADHENDTLRTNLDNEVTALIELADKNRKREDLLHSGIIMQDSKNSEEETK